MEKSIKGIVKLVETLLGRRPWGVSNTIPDEPYGEYLSGISPTPEELSAQAGARGLPTLAIAIVGGGCEGALRRTMDSLRAQSYPGWKLVSSPGREEFGYIMYMWPGDVLPPNALYEFAIAARGRDLLFCDEDRQGGEGRCDPRFKPDLSVFTQLSYDMLGSGVMVSRALFRAAGPMRGEGGDGRYAYNLSCALKAASPLHIPKPLYTCREYREPGPDSRLSAEAASGGGIALPGQWRGSFRVEARIKRQSAAIIIRNRNRHEPLMALLSSIDRAHREEGVSIVIADQGSADQRTLAYYRILERNGAARVFYGGDMPLPKLLNEAAREADRDAAVFMDSGVEVLSVNWIDGLLRQVARPGAGAAGPKIIGPDGRLAHTGTVIGIGGWQGSAYAGTEDGGRAMRKRAFTDSLREVSALTSVCMMVSMDAFFNAGCFDESFEEAGFDTELCLRLGRRGRACLYVPHVTVRCSRPIPGIAQAGEADQLRCYDAMRDMLLNGDPHYSPNFGYASPIPRATPSPRPAIYLNGRYGGR